MGDVLDMSLDDLIDQKRSTVSKTSKSPGNTTRGRGGSRGGRGRGGRAIRSPVGIGSRLRQRRGGASGVGKKTGGTRATTTSAALKVIEANHGMWRHDKYEEAIVTSTAGENGSASTPLETGSKLLVSNLERNVSSIELKVQNQAKWMQLPKLPPFSCLAIPPFFPCCPGVVGAMAG